ncbi:MAG: peptidyl-prolyl cis-trans isomerase [Alphaproteobacteria bacterium]
MFVSNSSSRLLKNEVPVLNAAQGAKAHSRLRRYFSVVYRWLREPLLHFLLIGVVLFGFYSYLNRSKSGTQSPKQIVLSLDELATMTAYFESQWHRPPTPKEFQAMVEDKVKEEVLYREGLVMGLDKDDTIVKRRMVQKVLFLVEDVAAAHEPSTAELKAWFEKNTDKFALPSRYSFRHVYFSPDKRGKNAYNDAAGMLTKIAGRPEDSSLIAPAADRFMFQDYYGDRTPSAIAKEFGPQFAVALEKVKPGSWQGPIESGYGWHLVFVDTVIPGRVPAFEEIESDVKTAWLGEQKAQARDKAYKSLRSKYTVLLPAPPDKQIATAPTPPPKTEIPTSSGEGL